MSPRNRLWQAAGIAALATLPTTVLAAETIGATEKQATNWTAIVIFGLFVVGTLFITKWAASRTKSAADFYTAGGGITGFQNGLAIAGDYMSAASFLGISAAVMISGYDGLIYSIGFLVGWPVITFLMAERLRNLGKFTFADVAAFRFAQTPVRVFAASGTLVVVAFYLIAQMVGAGQLIKLLFGLDYWIAVVLVGALMMVYVLFGGMTATTWVQIIKACLLLGGRVVHGLHGDVALRLQPGGAVPGRGRREDQARRNVGGSTPEEALQKGLSIMGPGSFIKDPISAISFGMALMFGTAGLPHILMRFFTVPSAKEARKSVMWATGWIGYFYLLTFIIGFGAITFVLTDPGFLDARRRADRRQQHGGRASCGRGRRQRLPRLHLGRGLRDHPRGGGGSDAVGRLGRHRTTSTRPSSRTGKADSARRADASRGSRRSASACWRSCSASSSRSRTSPSWSRWRSRWRPRRTSRCCSCRCCGRTAPPGAR